MNYNESSELEIDSIIHSYKNQKILSNIYIRCNKGDIIGLLGRNGSGKSTLLKIIFGTLNANSSNIRINKTPYKALYKIKNKIKYLPQDSFIPKYFSVKNLISFYIKDKDNKIKLLTDSRLSKILNTKIGNLSGGELKYLELLLIINNPSNFILLDEPFSNIEPIYKDRIKEEIKNYSKYSGFIITDHDYINILDICTKIILLKNGSTIEISNKNELIKYGYLPE